MSTLSFVLFLLAGFYIVGALLEFPIMFEGNPKTRWMMKKIGKKNLKIVILAFSAIFIALAIYFK